jgi:hypothetical protein
MSRIDPARHAAALTQAHRLFDKVFCIGANKTGTSTMQAVFRDLGLRVAPQQEGELAAIRFYRGQFGPLKDYIARHDAFQDAPFSIKSTYAQVDALFPGSKFILTHRPAAAWFRSLVSYHLKILGEHGQRERPSAEAVQQFDYLFPGYLGVMAEVNWLGRVDADLQLERDWSLLYDEAHYTALYEQRNRDIVRHFSERPQDLLVIDVTAEPDTRRIVEFLGLPDALARPMPHENRT